MLRVSLQKGTLRMLSDAPFTLSETITIRHSPDHVFRVASDVSSYVKFLPWCKGSVVKNGGVLTSTSAREGVESSGSYLNNNNNSIIDSSETSNGRDRIPTETGDAAANHLQGPSGSWYPWPWILKHCSARHRGGGADLPSMLRERGISASLITHFRRTQTQRSDPSDRRGGIPGRQRRSHGGGDTRAFFDGGDLAWCDAELTVGLAFITERYTSLVLAGPAGHRDPSPRSNYFQSRAKDGQNSRIKRIAGAGGAGGNEENGGTAVGSGENTGGDRDSVGGQGAFVLRPGAEFAWRVSALAHGGGPFSRLTNRWDIEPDYTCLSAAGEPHARVRFSVDFTFSRASNPVHAAIFSSLFAKAASRMMAAFVERCDQVPRSEEIWLPAPDYEAAHESAVRGAESDHASDARPGSDHGYPDGDGLATGPWPSPAVNDILEQELSLFKNRYRTGSSLLAK